MILGRPTAFWKVINTTLIPLLLYGSWIAGEVVEILSGPKVDPWARDLMAVYTLHPTPYTLHPTPYTLHPTPYTLHPTPYSSPCLVRCGYYSRA